LKKSSEFIAFIEAHALRYAWETAPELANKGNSVPNQLWRISERKVMKDFPQ
jgi:hypothetical protein